MMSSFGTDIIFCLTLQRTVDTLKGSSILAAGKAFYPASSLALYYKLRERSKKSVFTNSPAGSRDRSPIMFCTCIHISSVNLIQT